MVLWTNNIIIELAGVETSHSKNSRSIICLPDTMKQLKQFFFQGGWLERKSGRLFGLHAKGMFTQKKGSAECG
jgi:hypothetical protein